jgi:cytochrome c peroxidase
MRSFRYPAGAAAGLLAMAMCVSLSATEETKGNTANAQAGKHLFERETFGGNGRTCRTCHSAATGTTSPEDAQRRFAADPNDPLFLHDGSDDFQGHGASRMLADATVLVEVPLPANVTLADNPAARSVVVRRGIPTTLNTPALDPQLMFDGRQPTLEAQALGALHDHAQAVSGPTARELSRLIEFEKSDAFFSSPALLAYATTRVAPTLPDGVTESEKRGRRFFEDSVDFVDLKHGACAACHSGPMLNETNEFAHLAFGIPTGSRYISVGVSELNTMQNPLHQFVFANGDGSSTTVVSPDPGRALAADVPPGAAQLASVNAFKIPTLWGVGKTAPYFHDNSAKTLAAVASHYNLFFTFTSDPDGPAGPLPPVLSLTPQDQADIVAYMKLLK